MDVIAAFFYRFLVQVQLPFCRDTMRPIPESSTDAMSALDLLDQLEDLLAWHLQKIWNMLDIFRTFQSIHLESDKRQAPPT